MYAHTPHIGAQWQRNKFALGPFPLTESEQRAVTQWAAEGADTGLTPAVLGPAVAEDEMRQHVSVGCPPPPVLPRFDVLSWWWYLQEEGERGGE